MSKPNPRRAAKSSSRKPVRDAEHDESADRTTSRSAANAGTSRGTAENDPKDETNGDKKDGKTAEETTTTPSAPKPQSAGATIRDAGQRLLSLTMKQEWTSIDPVLKQLEKIVAAAGAEANLAPLAGVMDPVSFTKLKKKEHCVLFNGNIFIWNGIKYIYHNWVKQKF